MSPRPDVSEERKHQILDAAMEVFTRKGFDQARMDDIVEETGLSKGALYWYFKSKDDIIAAILDRIFQREFKQLEQLDISASSPTENLQQYKELVITDLMKFLRLIPIAYEFLALAFRNKLVQQVIKGYLNRYMDSLVPIIQRGIDQGEFRRLDPKEVAIAAGAIFEGTILLWVYDSSLVDPEHHIRTGIDLLLEGVRADPAIQ